MKGEFISMRNGKKIIQNLLLTAVVSPSAVFGSVFKTASSKALMASVILGSNFMGGSGTITVENIPDAQSQHDSDNTGLFDSSHEGEGLLAEAPPVPREDEQKAIIYGQNQSDHILDNVSAENFINAHNVSFTSAVANADEIINEDSLVDETCISFEADPRHPEDEVSVVADPWNKPEVCKLLIAYGNSNYVCSASLVGPYHLLTARHCTFHGCLGEADRVRVACGYGHTPGGDDFAHYGTAEIDSCVRYQSYDDATTCTNGKSGSIGLKDIQICRLDRKIGDMLGWFGTSSETLSDVTVDGYPGNGDLNDFIDFATNSRLTRREAVSLATTERYTVHDMWAWGGESGCPYYDERQVSAVHRGGPTGCTEYGTRVTNDLVESLKALRGEESASSLTPWTDPGEHCQVIRYQDDVFAHYDGALIGVGIEDAIYPVASQVMDQKFKARITLFNVGTSPATVTIRWYASKNGSITTSDELLGSTQIDIQAGQTYRTSVSDLPVSWPAGYRTIGAMWTTSEDCFTNDGNTAIIGKLASVEPKPSPAPIGGPTPTIPGPTPIGSESPTISTPFSSAHPISTGEDSAPFWQKPVIIGAAAGGAAVVAGSVIVWIAKKYCCKPSVNLEPRIENNAANNV